MALERRERRVLEDVLVRRFKDYARRLARLPRLDPAQYMQAPAVAGLEAAEAQLRPRRDEVVAARDAELEEFLGDLHAHEVRHAVGAGTSVDTARRGSTSKRGIGCVNACTPKSGLGGRPVGMLSA